MTMEEWFEIGYKLFNSGAIKPQRGLRANIDVYDDATSPCVTYECCPYCESYEYGDPKCPTCRKENYKFFKQKEN